MASSKQFAHIDLAGFKRKMQSVGGASKVLGKPFDDGRGIQAVKIMRTGTKGIYRQFVDLTEYRGSASIRWLKRKPFGTSKWKTMLASGAYRAAWLGKGGGADQRITPSSVAVSVDSGIHPQVKIHQSSKPFTIVRPNPKNRSKGGRLKMFWALWFKYGVMMSEKRLLKGFKIHRRRISVSTSVRREIARMVAKYTKARIRGITIRESL